MLVGTPMGEPSSCAQAASVCLDAEQNFHVQRERAHGDSSRIASKGFVDDLFFCYAYDRRERVWPRREAEELLRASRDIFPAPLSLK